MTEAENAGSDANRIEKVDEGDDVVGTFGLAFGLFAACCLLLGFCTLFATWLAVSDRSMADLRQWIDARRAEGIPAVSPA